MIDISGNTSYEDLTLIITEFEKQALESNTRKGILVVGQNPLTAFERMLDASDDLLTAALSKQTPEFTIQKDADLADLVGDDISGFLKNCLACDGRVSFNWQLKPTNILASIDKLLSDINTSLDNLSFNLNPYQHLGDICNFLNLIKTICIPDLIVALASLKMLQRKYMSDAISINLDWTVVFGPILKVLVQAISGFLQNIANIAIAPLNCTINVLSSATSLESQANQLYEQTAAFTNHLENSSRDIYESVSQGKIPQQIQTSAVIKNDQQTGVRANYTPAALPVNHNTFDSLTKKMTEILQEAEAYIQSFVNTILNSMNSLSSLVSGGLTLQVGKIGALLFLFDMVNLLVMSIKLLKENPNVTDWCSFLSESPEVLQTAIQARFDSKNALIVSKTNEQALLLNKGPATIMEIPLCGKKTSGPDAAIIASWISELNTKGS